MRFPSLPCCLFVVVFAASSPPSAHAVNITIDYTYDENNFFGAGNPSGAAAGAQARATIESVASFYSGLLQDTFSSIQTPPVFRSSFFDGLAYWNWTMHFPNPATGADVALDNQVVAANEYRLYVGARSLSGSTLGEGGPGGVGYNANNNGGGFTQTEVNQISSITDDFIDDVTTRGETSGFVSWGGAITFDRDASTIWHYDATTPPASGKDDFLSVVIHEMTHALGFGASDEWTALAGGPSFAGAAAAASYGSLPLLQAPQPPDGKRGHWAENTMSKILGTNTVQEAAMDPNLLEGTRKRLTALDAAALTDIGWTVGSVVINPADFNGDGFVNAADLSIWRGAFGSTTAGNADGDSDTDGADLLIWQRQLGAGSATPVGTPIPEPTSLLLAACGLAALRRLRGWLGSASSLPPAPVGGALGVRGLNPSHPS